MNGRSDERESLKAWLRDILATSGDTPTALARRAGIAQTTLTRFLNADDSPMLGTRSIAKIRHAVARAAPPPGFAEAEAVPFSVQAAEERMSRVILALIDGRPAADPWLIRTDALVLAGVLPGDIAIVDLNQATAGRPGDIVCAQDYRATGATTLFRIYEPPFLVAASLDREARKPLFVDGDRIVVRGVVTDLLRSRA